MIISVIGLGVGCITLLAYRILKGSKEQPKPMDDSALRALRTKERQMYENIQAEVEMLSEKFRVAIRTGSFDSVQQDHDRVRQLCQNLIKVYRQAETQATAEAKSKAKYLQWMSCVVQAWQHVQVALDGPYPILTIRASALELKWDDFQKVIQLLVEIEVKDLRVCVEGDSILYTAPAILQYLDWGSYESNVLDYLKDKGLIPPEELDRFKLWKETKNNSISPKDLVQKIPCRLKGDKEQLLSLADLAPVLGPS